jgi:hypothetical protein
MATPYAVLTFLLLLLPTILAKPCRCPSQCETNLFYYRHEFNIGSDPNRNQELVVQPNTSFVPGFGAIFVHSWTITEENNPKDTIIARMQGTHIGTAVGNSWYISSNIVFVNGP